MTNIFGARSCLPQLEFCCCGTSLRTGVLFIGWICTVFLIVVEMALLELVFHAVLGSVHGTGQQIAAVLFVEVWLLGLASTISSILLLAGVNMKKPKFLLPYMSIAVLMIISSAFLLLLTVFTDVENEFIDMTSRYNPVFAGCRRPGDESTCKYGYCTPSNCGEPRGHVPSFFFPACLLLLSLLETYFLMVVNSYYILMVGSAPPKYQAEAQCQMLA